MKAKTLTKYMNDNGEVVEQFNDTIFDHTQIFSFTVINNEETDEPELIEILTKNGISTNLLYDENLIISLAASFRKRNIL